MIDFGLLLDPASLASEVRVAVLPPPPTLTVSEWADQERVLGPEETSEPGRWRTDRLPYLKEIMDAVSNPEVRTVVVKGSARIGKTEFENNVIGYHIDQDPSSMLLVYPSDQKAKDYSKEKLGPMLRNTPSLRGKVSDAKSRDSDNTMLHKTFEGGFIALAGSNTPNGLDSRTCRIVLFDELDKCAKAAGNLGDPIALAKNRTITYPGRYKHILVSTPSEEGDSPITTEYEKSNMQELYLPCPHCGDFDTLKFVQIKWPEGHPELAVYVCPHCGAVIADADKPEMLRRREWRALRPEIVECQGFSVWAGYSPWLSWAQIAQTFVERRNDGPEALKVFVNEWLGETWKPNQGQEAKVEGLLKRARESQYVSGTVPNEVGILFGGGDTQDDRIEVLVRGVGVGRRKWTVQHIVLGGNPATKALWDRLEKVILSNWTREDGQEMRIKRFCLDAGGHFDREVHEFCKRSRMRGLAVPTRGATRPQIKVAIKAKRTARLWMLDTIALKDTIYAELRITEPLKPGYQRFPSDLEADYFQQLTCEKKIKGKYVPVPEGARNEIADLHVYCDGAEAIHGLRKGEIEQLVQFYADGKARRLGEPDDSEPIPGPASDPMPSPDDLEEVQVDPPPPEPGSRQRSVHRLPRIPRTPRGGGLIGW